MVDKNPNHKEEIPNKFKDVESTRAFAQDLVIQDPKEDFLSLKSQLLYYKNKDNLDKIPKISPESKFLMLGEEISQEDLLETGLDFCILADTSDSMYPFRIFFKKSLYFCLMDIENFMLTCPDVSAEHFQKIRFAFVQYSDRDTDKSVFESVDFVDYKSLGDICKKIDEIEIKQFSAKKRAVFDGMKAMSELSWNEDARKVIVHYCGDPQYGTKYTFNPKNMPSDYDPIPEGVKDIDESDLLDSIANLSATYNFIKFNDRVNIFQNVLKGAFAIDINLPKVDELK
jgi:hypothetical protein